MFVDEESGGFFFCGCLCINLAVKCVQHIGFQGNDVVFCLTGGKAFGGFFTENCCMMVIWGWDGWVNNFVLAYLPPGLLGPFLGLISCCFYLDSVASQGVLQPVNGRVELLEPWVF